MRQDNRIRHRPCGSEFETTIHRIPTDQEAWARVHLDLTTPVPVVRITGRLDRRAIHPCREALAVARAAREGTVVMDLAEVTASTRDTIPLLGAMRRFLASGGVSLRLARVPPHLESAMRDVGVWHLYDVVPG